MNEELYRAWQMSVTELISLNDDIDRAVRERTNLITRIRIMQKTLFPGYMEELENETLSD
jgi:hypothetical protein